MKEPYPQNFPASGRADPASVHVQFDGGLGQRRCERLRVTKYFLTSQWALAERFTINDESDQPVFSASGHRLGRLSITSLDGEELAAVDKEPNVDWFDVSVGGQDRAQVHSVGLLRVHYRAQLSDGTIETEGDFAGWNYTLTRNGTAIAFVSKQMGFREVLVVDIVDEDENVFLLAVVLAIARVRENPGRYSDNPS